MRDKMKKYRKRIIIILTSILLVLFVAVTALNFTSGRRVKKMLQEIRDAGEPLTLAEMAPPEIPDNENAAIPLEIAGKLLKQSAAEKDLGGNTLGELHQALLDENTRDQAIDALRNILDKNQEALLYLDQATALDKCRFDLDYDIEDVIGVIIPNVNARTSARILVVRALLLAATGQPDQAFDSIRQIFVISSFFKDAFCLIDTNTTVGLNKIGTDGLQKIVSLSTPSPRSCHRLIDALQKAKQTINMHRSFCGERLFGIGAFKRIKKSNRWVVAPDTNNLLTIFLSSIPQQLIPDFVVDYNYIHYLKIMDQMVASAKKPYLESKNDFLAIDKQVISIPKTLPIARMLTPALSRAMYRKAANAARLGATEIALRLIIYRVENGNFPKTLEMLNEDIPLDPYKNKSFLYRRGDEGFVVYSVGENLIDDGGIFYDKRKRPDVGFTYRYSGQE